MQAIFFYLSFYDDSSFVLHQRPDDAPVYDNVRCLATIRVVVKGRHIAAESEDFDTSLILPWGGP